MSSAISFYIGYARKDCDKLLVTKTFAAILGADYIEEIYESNKKDSLGKPHKTYKLTFNENTPGLQDIADRINREYFIKVAYKLEWDWKSRKYVERYWKVFNYVSPQAEFKPHIMESQPYVELTKDVKLSEDQLYAQFRKDYPFSILTDDEEVTKDFVELAQDIEKFGEKYPGSIAKKIPKPTRSDDPEEEIVLKCDQMYDAESEEWNELKAALEVFSGEPITFVREIPPISEWDKTPLKPPILRRATALQSEELLWNIPQGPSHIEQIWGEQVPPPPQYTRAENTLHNIC
jgi:hypothetical protein